MAAVKKATHAEKLVKHNQTRCKIRRQADKCAELGDRLVRDDIDGPATPDQRASISINWPPLPPPPPPAAHQSLTLASASLPAEGLEFPNTALLPGDLTEQLGVDNFFSLWLVFLDADIFTSGERETPPPSGGLVLGGRPTQWWWLLASSRSASVQTWPLPRSSSSSVAPVVVVVVVVVVVACLDRRCFGLTPTASS